MKIHKRQ